MKAMNTMPDFKFDITNDGKVEFDLYALLYELEGEKLNNLIEALSWQDAVVEKILGNVKSEYTSDFTNSHLYHIRKKFFTTSYSWEKKNIVQRMKSTMDTILSQIAYEKADKLKMQDGWSAVYNTILDRFGEDCAWDMNEIYVDARYDKSLSSTSISREMTNAVKELPSKDELIESWVGQMIELFSDKDGDNG
jgi:hypothetical protein